MATARISPHAKIIAEVLNITPERARLVEGYMRLKFSTLGHLFRDDYRREYHNTSGGISATIDADPAQAEALARSYGL